MPPKKMPKKQTRASSNATAEEGSTLIHDAVSTTPKKSTKRKPKTPKTPKAKTPRKKKESTVVTLELGSDSELENDQASNQAQDIKKLEAMRARMDLLERDNYVDREGAGGRTFSVNNDDENEEWNNETLASPKKGSKRKKKDAPEDEPNSKKRKNDGKKSRSVKFVRRKLDGVLKLDKVDSSPSPNYFSIISPPSILPPRKFCSITGLKSNYTCSRSGEHFINLEAYEHIKKNHNLE